MVSAVWPRDKTESVQLISAVMINLHLSTSTCVVSECMVQQRLATNAHMSHGLSERLQTSPTLLERRQFKPRMLSWTNLSKFAFYLQPE
jgi:hypothetical protein